MTDVKGRRASRGWIFFDRDCGICTSLARRFRHTLEKRGFGLAALQDPRVAALLGLPLDQLLLEMRVVTCEGEFYGGAGAIVYLAGKVWWAWPVYALAKLPAVVRILDAGYRRFAEDRRGVSDNCPVSRKNRIGNPLGHPKGEPK